MNDTITEPLSRRLIVIWSQVFELADDCAEEDKVELLEIADHLRRLAVAYRAANL